MTNHFPESAANAAYFFREHCAACRPGSRRTSRPRRSPPSRRASGGIADRRAERNHVQPGIGAADDAALQPGVNGRHGGLLPVQRLVGGGRGLQDRRLHVRVPAVVGAREFRFGPGQRRAAMDSPASFSVLIELRSGIGVSPVLPSDTTRARFVEGLHQPGHGHRHPLHPSGQAATALVRFPATSFGSISGRFSDLRDLDRHRVLDAGVLGLTVSS